MAMRRQVCSDEPNVFCGRWSNLQVKHGGGRKPLDVDAGLRHHEDRAPTHGYSETREAAMAAFAKSWRRDGAFLTLVEQAKIDGL